jgi:hypothetical protein
VEDPKPRGEKELEAYGEEQKKECEEGGGLEEPTFEAHKNWFLAAQFLQKRKLFFVFFLAR